MGTRSVKLEMSQELTYHHPNDTIRGSIEHDLKEQVSMQVLPLKNKAEVAFKHARFGSHGFYRHPERRCTGQLIIELCQTSTKPSKTLKPQRPIFRK